MMTNHHIESGHPGVTKMHAILDNTYSWPQMAAGVTPNDGERGMCENSIFFAQTSKPHKIISVERTAGVHRI